MDVGHQGGIPVGSGGHCSEVYYCVVHAHTPEHHCVAAGI